MATGAPTDTGYRFVEKDSALDALRASVPELIATLRAVRDPNKVAIGHWTIRDVTAHLADTFENYRNVALGQGSAQPDYERIAEYNEKRVSEIDERDVRALTDRIEVSVGPYLDAISSVDGDPLVPWAGLHVPVSTIIGFGILECVMHGWDVATAEGRSFRVDPGRAALGIKAISPATMHYVDRDAAAGFRATYDVRVRGHWQMDFIFDDGTLLIAEPTGTKADCHISADPVAFALVGYGRVGQWGPALKGQMVTWGRKPWLAFRFSKLLKNP